ncbi:MAG: hypothetical protein IKI23_10950 [Lachnospiraceae bacterium]|nr:hypothetical protein [Lachnospiraceae bacterium]
MNEKTSTIETSYTDAYGNDTKVTMARLTSESVRIIQDRNSYVIISGTDGS